MGRRASRDKPKASETVIIDDKFIEQITEKIKLEEKIANEIKAQLDKIKK